MNTPIVLIVHNVRSSHNVGSLLRTAEGLGINEVFLTGYTPYPVQANDSRLPHLATKQAKRINKTALGAEELVKWQYKKDLASVISHLKNANFTVVALEQTAQAQSISRFKNAAKIALIVGNEVDGLNGRDLALADLQLQIPMKGRKESFNVSVAAAIALYHLKLKGDRQID